MTGKSTKKTKVAPPKKGNLVGPMNMPEQGNVKIEAYKGTFYSPLPPPEIFNKYPEDIRAFFIERFKKEQDFHHKNDPEIQKLAFSYQHKDVRNGQLVSGLITLCAIVGGVCVALFKPEETLGGLLLAAGGVLLPILAKILDYLLEKYFSVK